MVRQYRNALERETLEIPAGGLEWQRENLHGSGSHAWNCKEETGYQPTDHVKLLTSIYTQ